MSAVFHEAAPAKVNLALHVRARLADGYHALETLFAFTAFGDTLEAQPAADWALHISGPTAADAGNLADNLVLRAAHAFAAASGRAQRFAFHLHKAIPVAAGLGGGSADAAACLRLLNRAAGAPLPPAQLEALGATLGADVAACVRAQSCIGQGRGDSLCDGPTLTGLPILLVNPGVAVPTGAVFAGWNGIDAGPMPADWRQGRNDLEVPAIALQPVIADTLAWLRTLPGVQLTRMSGSGATCFALFSGDVPPVVVPAGWWAVATRLL